MFFYKLALLGQFKTMTVVFESIPQFLLHLYVLYVVTDSATKSSADSTDLGSTVSKTNYTQIIKRFNDDGYVFDTGFTFFIKFGIQFEITAKRLIFVKLLFSIKSFVVDFSNYKRTTLELHKNGKSWQSRNYSGLMMSTAKWTDNITQFIFFSARAMVLIGASTHGFFWEYVFVGSLKTFVFHQLYDQG